MFKKLRDAFVPQSVKNVTAHPHEFVEASLAIQAFWTNNLAITKDFTPEFKEQQAKVWAAKVLDILGSTDPLQKTRDEVVGLVAACAPFQVLVIDSPPAADQTGLRGWLGISGELRQNLELLSHTNGPLAAYLQSFGGALNLDAKWNAVLFRYRILWAGMNIFNSLRKPMGDIHPEIGSDWFWPFLAIQCAVTECFFRGDAGLPLTLNPDPVVAANISSTLLSLTDLIKGGTKHPDLEWEHMHGIKLPRYTPI
ncbi:hypothetical protein ABXK61_09335 [Burkholderia sola]|uniref:hypothetical protein n=1 Tax=Burkholderia TaxID=32008 RepID=UPI001AE2C2C7|nr:hypothetical protein [Burkholderia sp. AcTa6-5]MBP0713514.1 hypothetical protein [Burkholderia sp. AcTa6-5]